MKTISPLLFPLTRITCKRVDAEGGTIGIADARHGEGKRYVVHADEKLTSFV